MGDSHYRSNIKGLNGTQKLTNFHTASVDVVKCATLTGSGGITATTSVTGATIEGTTSVTSPKVICTSYVTVGSDKYIFSGATGENSASIVELASALVGVSKKGSIYLGNVVWGFDSDGTATKLK